MIPKLYPRRCKSGWALRIVLLLLLPACSTQALRHNTTQQVSQQPFDVIIRGGVVYDGSGSPGVLGDVGIVAKRIVEIGDLSEAQANLVISADGKAVAPGFINVLSWAATSLIYDGRGLSDLAQGVTLEIFGEGISMGPLANKTRSAAASLFPGAAKYVSEWTTLDEFLTLLTARGTSLNVASLVGATTVRINHVGFENRSATKAELSAMAKDVEQAMRQGALGVGSSLIYPPASYANTEELVTLARVAGRYGGVYASHIRSEGARLLESIDEILQISKEADVGVHIYHLKAAGRENWAKLESAIEKINTARADGLSVTADIYPYAAGSAGLLAATPPWAQEGGFAEFIERAMNPTTRQKIIQAMEDPSDEWEQLLKLSGGGDGVTLLGFRDEALRALVGRTLSDVAEERGTSPEATILDLIVEDRSPVTAAYLLANEQNASTKIVQPWVSVGSDAGATPPEGAFLKFIVHPRTYGSFARILSKYVRQEGILSLEEGIRRMTTLPANTFGISDRGRLEVGSYADIVVFDPSLIQDHATFANPWQLATGVQHVLVNGTQVIRDGEPTEARPGMVVRGPGYRAP